MASKPNDEVQNEWYISTLPSKTYIFIDRVSKQTLVENMREPITVEKHILALDKKNSFKEQKSKKLNFRDKSEKKAFKYPFDLECQQKVVKTMSNEMVEIRK